MKVAALEQGQVKLRRLPAGFIRRKKFTIAQVPQLGAEIKETLRDDMDHEARALQPPTYSKEMRSHDRAAIFFEDFRPDDDVGGAGLVFECHENDALGRAWHLPDENEAGNGH